MQVEYRIVHIGNGVYGHGQWQASNLTRVLARVTKRYPRMVHAIETRLLPAKQ